MMQKAQAEFFWGTGSRNQQTHKKHLRVWRTQTTGDPFQNGNSSELNSVVSILEHTAEDHETYGTDFNKIDAKLGLGVPKNK